MLSGTRHKIIRVLSLGVLGVLPFVLVVPFAAFAQDIGTTPLPSAPVNPPANTLKKVLETCFQCHGPGGISQVPSKPTIAGQKRKYIFRELMAFQNAAQNSALTSGGDVDKDADNGRLDNGRLKDKELRSLLRSDPVMEHRVDGLDFQTIGKISATIAKLSCRKDEAKVRRQSPPPNVAPCVSCHGENGIGRRDDIPNLAGQQRAYLRRQLLLIRESAWGAAPREGEGLRSHPIMEREIVRFKIKDVDALAKYYASLDCKG